MANERYRVTFEPEGKTVYVLDGNTIYEATGKAGIIIKSECGGMGVCGSCVVNIIKGKYEQKGSERFLSEEEIQRGTVLACRTHIKSDMIVEIPIASRLYEQKILTEGIERELKLSPNISKLFIKVDQPTLSDQRSDLDRMWDAIQNVSKTPRICVDVLRRLPEKMRKEGFGFTVVLNEDEIVGIEAGDKSKENYGVALDIGTTTVVGYLIDLNTGKQRAVSSRTNPQISYGDDVITRIQYANSNKDGLEDLHERIISCVNDIIIDLSKQANIEKKFIYELTTTGNTTMNHLLLQLNPKYLAQMPYVGVLRANIDSRAKSLGININTYGKLYAMPNIAGFVGGDTVGVILASDIHKSDDIKFAIDIGTNGELVMGNKERLIACSTAAGPAFEGARITYGMRASDGAIEKVVINESGIEINTIGNAKAVGLCGTGLIDAVAELLKAGVISENGKLRTREELPLTAPEFVRERVIKHEKHGASFILVEGRYSRTGDDILLTQKDVRETQLAKGAIHAGFVILEKVLNITDDDIKEVLLAGAFGNYIRREQAKNIGLLPDIPTERIKFIGNAAGEGAKMVLIAKELRNEACEISKNTEYIELSTRQDFQKEFMEAMFFPVRAPLREPESAL
jgi:uncharacterized 2Fe-2S/4Fe-4S cluster protein (DUF4445 family)